MSETLHEPLDPATFNVEAFLQDAHLPEESVTVYKRPDIVGKLSELKRRIEAEARVAVHLPDGPERAAGEPALTPLEQEYLTQLEAFSASALTVYVRALTKDQLRTLREETEARTKDWAADDANEEFGLVLVAAAIHKVAQPGHEPVPAHFTVEHVKALRDAIGSSQVSQILVARQMAQNSVPKVDADFLLRRSGTEAGDQ